MTAFDELLRRTDPGLVTIELDCGWVKVAGLDPADLDVAMNGVWVCRASTPDEDPSGVDLSGREVTVTIDLKAGTERATVWTNDLTHAYVHENSAYSS